MRLWGIYSGGETVLMAETCQRVAVGPCKQLELRTRWWVMGAALLVLPGAPELQIPPALAAWMV